MGCLEILVLAVLCFALLGLFVFAVELAVCICLGVLLFGGIGFLLFGATGLKIGGLIGLVAGIVWAFN